MSGIGPRLPLYRDDKYGNYGLITSYAEEVKQNFKNLLLTTPGERMMNPDFGVGLRHFLFESKQDAISKIRQRIEGQVTRYMPFVRVEKIQFNHNVDPRLVDDSIILSILVEYSVPSLKISTEILVETEDTN
jgi:phage baseplate assembly protein W